MGQILGTPIVGAMKIPQTSVCPLKLIDTLCENKRRRSQHNPVAAGATAGSAHPSTYRLRRVLGSCSHFYICCVTTGAWSPRGNFYGATNKPRSLSLSFPILSDPFPSIAPLSCLSVSLVHVIGCCLLRISTGSNQWQKRVTYVTLLFYWFTQARRTNLSSTRAPFFNYPVAGNQHEKSVCALCSRTTGSSATAHISFLHLLPSVPTGEGVRRYYLTATFWCCPEDLCRVAHISCAHGAQRTKSRGQHTASSEIVCASPDELLWMPSHRFTFYAQVKRSSAHPFFFLAPKSSILPLGILC